ncbi:MAG TPA: hypothetical protein VLC79_13955 [Cellvibrio sp.]|nr:hypothetical protein [Cellvibrio sp.]
MNTTSKPLSQAKRAAILSATIFPGAGLFFLRRYLRGCIFAVPALIIVAMLFKNLIVATVKLNQELAAEAEKGNLALDIAHMWGTLHGSLFTSPYWDQGKWVLLASWLLSIVSSYFAGKQVDQSTQT